MLTKEIKRSLRLLPKHQVSVQPRCTRSLRGRLAVACRLAWKSYALQLFFLLLSVNTIAQFTVTINLASAPPRHLNDTVYLAGSFNGWAPAHEGYQFTGNSVVLKLGAGLHEFKFTRGSWDRVECTNEGRDIGNHILKITADTTISLSIAGWKDDFAAKERRHTVSDQSRLLQEDFRMPLLNKLRRIWVYLPSGYNKSNTRYPVLYMHDAQNVFDEYFAPFGEWGVDEIVDSLAANGKPACIVIAIENGQMDRMSEYNPYEFTWKSEKDTIVFSPKGDDYLKDIVETLKPYIDKKYKTLGSKENTIIAGSSMGGLISYYAAIKYPSVFGKAGIFSPAFWTAKSIDSLTDADCSKLKGKYFFYMGGKEGGTYVEDMKRICEKVGRHSSALIYSVIDPEAEHKEKYWRKWFAEFYTWMMADGYNINTSSKTK